MTEVAVPQNSAIEEAILRELRLNPADPKTRAVLYICDRYDLDPVLKHVVLVDGKPYITRDGLLHVAHRSGQLDGIEVVTDPHIVEDTWMCKVAVYRKDMSHPFAFTGRYPTKGGNQKYAPEMALKTAEVMALRRAFDVTGIPAVDEQLPDDNALTKPVERSKTKDPDDPWADPAPEQLPGEVIEDLETADTISAIRSVWNDHHSSLTPGQKVALKDGMVTRKAELDEAATDQGDDPPESMEPETLDAVLVEEPAA